MTSPDFAIEGFRPSTGFLGTMRKYSKIVRASLVERMTYRLDFILGTLFRFLPILTTILLWRAIYTGAGDGSDPKSAVLSNFTYRQMIAYLLLTNISRFLSCGPIREEGSARNVSMGRIK